ncbi:hypothetical protein ONS95_002964 [Cadophora gregata]|uniref:uncharacterized protein n=1 Tax=Cadophora gregata TaxID=51156 RepID=UPI0026DC56C7|nr:uncharacterized protein ONS95_002964 [Cadophora gregata]KAK0108142.1 hypothetical protein ONS95_002964 [Cadophora gregata]KAK0109263.1 hypothetical protein ONS96_003085 [Cadophora gregata f. sp. sojae]
MASLFLARGLHSLIAARDTTLGSNIPWSGITKRNEPSAIGMAGAIILWLLIICVLIPAFFFIVYTLDKLVSTLAIVEADSPPEYELVAVKEANGPEVEKVTAGSSSKDVTIADTVSESSSSSSQLMPDETAGLPSTPSKPITSSLFATIRLIRSSANGMLKAYRWHFAHNSIWLLAIMFISGIPYMQVLPAMIIASFATTKIETAWTHAVLTSQRDGDMFRKLPSHFTIFKATAIPLTARAVLTQVVHTISLLIFGERTGNVDPVGVIPTFEKGGSIMVISMFCITYFTLNACLLIPVEVVLVRTRATMLAEDVTTMVQLDSSIRSQTVEDIGFMSWLHVWRTFSRASWIRIIKMNAKVLGMTIATESVAVGIVAAHIFIINAMT